MREQRGVTPWRIAVIRHYSYAFNPIPSTHFANSSAVGRVAGSLGLTQQRIDRRVVEAARRIGRRGSHQMQVRGRVRIEVALRGQPAAPGPQGAGVDISTVLVASAHDVSPRTKNPQRQVDVGGSLSIQRQIYTVSTR